MPKEKCLRCEGSGRDPEFAGEQCRVCKGTGERQPDIVLDVQSVRMKLDVQSLTAGEARAIIE
jgi:DnaJ-class molecular chaperone